MDSISQVVERDLSIKSFITDFKQLTKVGLSLSVVFSSVAGYLLRSRSCEHMDSCAIGNWRLFNGWRIKCF